LKQNNGNLVSGLEINFKGKKEKGEGGCSGKNLNIYLILKENFKILRS